MDEKRIDLLWLRTEFCIDSLYLFSTFRFDYALKLSEMEQIKRDHEADMSLLDAPQSTWKASELFCKFSIVCGTYNNA